MSRQVQIRRGSATAHTNFTGAIGEITMDTTNKTLRVHDGETPGGTILAKQSEIPTVPDLSTADYVVESQAPTSDNNYTWYRKYKSGWVEQGGVINPTNSTGLVINLPVSMANSNYTCCISPAGNDNDTGGWGDLQAVICGASSSGYTYGKSSTSIRLSCTSSVGINWFVAGTSL